MKTTNKGKKLIIIGFTSIAILFLLYGRYQDPEVFTPSALESIQRIALGFYITIIISFGGIAFGMYKYHKSKVENKGKDILTIIAITTYNSKSRKILSLFLLRMEYFFH